MKALSVKQPWAELIASGRKTIETRTWRTKYRGPLLICAGKTVDKEAHEHFVKQGFFLPEGTYPRGYALTVVDLDDCRPMTRDDEEYAWCRYLPNTYSWVLSNLRREFNQYKMTGRQGLFECEVKPLIILAEYCPGPFYMGWWLYERDRNDGSINDWDGWGWLQSAERQEKVYNLCCAMGCKDLPKPVRYSDEFAEAFGKRFPKGISVSRIKKGFTCGDYDPGIAVDRQELTVHEKALEKSIVEVLNEAESNGKRR